MTDEGPESPEEVSEQGTEVETEVETEAPPPKRRRRWKWPLILLGVFIMVPAVLFALWVWIALSWSYSEGRRAGYVQKFSQKGWMCKTWEGELSMVNIPGAMQERWLFTVRDDSVANEIQDLMGKQVSLEYEEHPGVPTSCFGETNYFVTGVRKVP
ncbi:MAG: hypothetical protein WD825_15725 [Gemmatimonadaceae bacterium]